jgi:hypothetical protein
MLWESGIRGKETICSISITDQIKNTHSKSTVSDRCLLCSVAVNLSTRGILTSSRQVVA